VARLEDELGVALLRRSARSFTLTGDGQLVLLRAAGALRELGDLEQSLADLRGEPRGRLVVTAPHDLGRQEVMAELLATYRARCPGVTVEVRLAERMVDLVREGVDVGLRAHTGEIPGEAGLMARALALPPVGLFASPDYVARCGVPLHPDELSEHDWVAHVAHRDALELHSASGATCAVPLTEVAVRVNDFGLVRRLVCAGAGIGVLPTAPTDELVRLLPEWSARAAQLSLVWQASRHQSPRVRAFIDLAVEVLSGTWSPS
jgi:DNA-binding transcriptional LysR family regulator